MSSTNLVFDVALFSMFIVPRVRQKSKPPTCVDIFANYWPIFKILSVPHSVDDLQ